MKQKFEKSEILDVVGVLDCDETGRKVITVEAKDSVNTYSVDEILEALVGREVEIKSVATIDEV